MFFIPDNWQGAEIEDAPLIKDFTQLWKELSDHYSEELGKLAYRPIPSPEEIAKSMSGLFEIVQGKGKNI